LLRIFPHEILTRFRFAVNELQGSSCKRISVPSPSSLSLQQPSYVRALRVPFPLITQWQRSYALLSVHGGRRGRWSGRSTQPPLCIAGFFPPYPGRSFHFSYLGSAWKAHFSITSVKASFAGFFPLVPDALFVFASPAPISQPSIRPVFPSVSLKILIHSGRARGAKSLNHFLSSPSHAPIDPLPEARRLAAAPAVRPPSPVFFPLPCGRGAPEATKRHSRIADLPSPLRSFPFVVSTFFTAVRLSCLINSAWHRTLLPLFPAAYPFLFWFHPNLPVVYLRITPPEIGAPVKDNSASMSSGVHWRQHPDASSTSDVHVDGQGPKCQFVLLSFRFATFRVPSPFQYDPMLPSLSSMNHIDGASAPA